MECIGRIGCMVHTCDLPHHHMVRPPSPSITRPIQPCRYVSLVGQVRVHYGTWAVSQSDRGIWAVCQSDRDIWAVSQSLTTLSHVLWDWSGAWAYGSGNGGDTLG